MTEESVITEELRSMLGVEEEPQVNEVEKGHIRQFVEAVGDPNLLWQDQEYARKSRYGGIIAPPTFIQEWGLKKLAPKVLEANCPLTMYLYGGVETEFHGPVRLGDVITARSKLSDMYEKEGKSGKLLFLTMEVSYTNQLGGLIAISRHTFIKRE